MPEVIKKRLRLINIVSTIVLCVMCAGATVFGIVPLYRDGAQNIADAASLRQKLSDLDGLSQTLSQVENERKQTAFRLQEAEARLPNSNAMDQFMQQLAKVAENAGLQVDGITPSKEIVDADGYKSLPVQISGIGTWDTCYQFLTGLRKMNRLTRLDSLTIDGDKDHANVNSSSPLCHISVNISTFMAR